MNTVVIGTRGSPLALWQANWVKERIETKNPGVSVTLKKIHTRGDKILDSPLALIGGKGLFVKELENELIKSGVDIAVHSMKDVPAILPPELEISVICKREDPRDALVARKATSFDSLPQSAKVGTSSLRRKAQMLHRRPDIEVVSLRGNVGTRIKKLDEQNLDAIILALAGLKRMGCENIVTERMDPSVCLPAVAQGAMGIETRKNDEKIMEIIGFLNDHNTRLAVETERAFLTRLEGGCQAPIAAYATIEAGKVTLDGLVAELDGSVIYREKMTAPVNQRISLGVEVAEKILERAPENLV